MFFVILILLKSSWLREKNKYEYYRYKKMLEEKLERTLKLLDDDEKGGEGKEESRSSSSSNNENDNENKASPTSPFDLESSSLFFSCNELFLTKQALV